MKVQINKFKRLQDKTIQIPAEIFGGNGTGKTTILEAIVFCLTGKDLNGATMEQIYDNREDLHDALADVAFFDNYGNEYRRRVQPVFETSRDGQERLKILRSTRCTKNDIDTNDFADEFADFYLFGTDYFFAQKETVQRNIFIDLMKSLLPAFDVKEAQEKLKSLQKTQRDTISDIKSIRAMLKELKNEDIVPIPDDLQKLEDKYQELLSSNADNQSAISKVNTENNNLLSAYRLKKGELENQLDEKKRAIKRMDEKISGAEEKLQSLQRSEFEPEALNDVSELKTRQENLKQKMAGLEYFDDLQEFGKKYATENPIVVQNIEKIKALKNGESDEVTDICPACGVGSEQARQKSLTLKVDAIKQENRNHLYVDMRESNNKYLTAEDELSRVTANLEKQEAENSTILERNSANERNFKIKKTNDIEATRKEIKQANEQRAQLLTEAGTITAEMEQLSEPTLKTLPEELTISEDLKAAHKKFASIRDEQIGAKAVNTNNQKIKAAKEAEIKEKQELLAELDGDVAELQKEISDYFSNLDEIVAKEFAGPIEIGVQLLEYVITKNEYKDCFKITANDKIFPHECNGALINNVKLQILKNLQRLKGYTGITIMDNAEANTTQPLHSEGLNLIVARATKDESLTIN